MRRIRLAFFAVLGLAQIIAFSVILGMHYSDQCDTPLAPYLVMVIVRIAAAFPRACSTSSSNPRRSRTDPPDLGGTPPRSLLLAHHLPAAAQPSRPRRRPCGPGPEPPRRLARHRPPRAPRRRPHLGLLGRALRARHWWVISATSCQADSPTLYRGAVAALVLSWLYVAEILVWAVLVIFFLPFVLVSAGLCAFARPDREGTR